MVNSTDGCPDLFYTRAYMSRSPRVAPEPAESLTFARMSISLHFNYQCQTK